MQTEPQTRVIDGFTYELSPLPAWQAVEVFTALTKLVGPGVLAALKKGEDATGDGAAQALAGALSATSSADVQAVAKRLLSTVRVTVDGGAVVALNSIVDVHFQGRILSLFKVVAFAIEVNFADFYAAFRGLGARLGARLQSATGLKSTSPQAPKTAGLSGDSSPAGGQPSPS